MAEEIRRKVRYGVWRKNAGMECLGSFEFARKETAQKVADAYNEEEQANAGLERRKVREEFVVATITTTVEIR